MPRRNYREGDWFLITAPRGIHGVGLIARGRKGWTPFAYIFGPWNEPPPVFRLRDLRPDDALLLTLLNDAPIREDLWPIIWRDPTFSREQWPMPEFGRYLGEGEPAWALTLSDDNPFDEIRQRQVAPEVALKLPQPWLAAEAIIFTKLSDPDWDVPRLSDAVHPDASEIPESSQTQEIRAFFIVPGNDPEKTDALRAALQRAWRFESAPYTDEQGTRTGDMWIMATRSIERSREPSVDELDRELEELAKSVGIEYDGHEIEV